MKKYFIFILTILTAAHMSYACTDFQIETEDNNAVVARSMEFAIPLNSKVIIHPAGEKLSTTSPDGSRGLSWESKYSYVAVDAFGLDRVVDGLNEKGLSCGFLWLKEAEYENPSRSDYKKAMAIEDLGTWILGNFSSIQEVKDALKSVKVWGKQVEALQGVPPLHVALHDAAGNNAVVEFIDGEKKIYDNPVGVLTNSPQFEWHMQNLRNYVGITSYNAKPITINGKTFKGIGQGSGLAGVPGDFTPPSRFVRASTFIRLSDPAKNVTEGINLANHILNTVDIPKGVIKEEKEKQGLVEGHTLWVVIKDLNNKILYFRTYENLALRSIDLKKIKLEESKSISIETGGGIEDLTSKI